MERKEMNATLTGERRFTMERAARLIGVCYETVRRAVVVEREVPFERRGRSRKPDTVQGRKVLIDEHGLQRLADILARSNADERSESALPRSASKGSVPGLSGSLEPRG
jgi:hypothetical protein